MPEESSESDLVQCIQCKKWKRKEEIVCTDMEATGTTRYLCSDGCLEKYMKKLKGEDNNEEENEKKPPESPLGHSPTGEPPFKEGAD